MLVTSQLPQAFWMKQLAEYGTRLYKKFYRTQTIGYDEVEGLHFQEIKSCFNKTGSHFYGHMMNHIPFKLESHTIKNVANKMALEFYMMKDEWVMTVFWRGAVKKLEKLSFWVLSENFITCFKVWHYQKWNFTVSKTAVSRFL